MYLEVAVRYSTVGLFLITTYSILLPRVPVGIVNPCTGPPKKGHPKEVIIILITNMVLVLLPTLLLQDVYTW